jgi:putative protein-disulfide isomerase
MIEKKQSRSSTLYYVYDPMCSWCWAFRPTWRKIVESRPTDLSVQLVLGGLAPNTEEPMPKSLQMQIRSIWKTIEAQVPGTAFNFDFWDTCRPRRSTYPACRAVIAATRQGPEYEDAMILAIQQAYYLEARNPSDESTLIELAVDLGLNATQFAGELVADETHDALLAQIALGRQIGARGFPSLILERNSSRRLLRIDYDDPARIVQQVIDDG